MTFVNVLNWLETNSIELLINLFMVIRIIRQYSGDLRQTASSSEIKVIQSQKSQALRIVMGTPWFVRNERILTLTSESQQ